MNYVLENNIFKWTSNVVKRIVIYNNVDTDNKTEFDEGKSKTT